MYRHRVGVVYLKLSRLVVSVGCPGGEQVEKHLEQVHVFSGYIRDLKDGTHPGHTYTNAEVTKELFPPLVLNVAGTDLLPLRTKV